MSSPLKTLPVKALSLLELLVVMAIILILLALFVPACYQLIKYVQSLGQ